ncbi:phytase [Kallotenue papyrolyticum]|uniref:phytase n=1 Tax=Kallotenue papyrolyticum TaxID=1325125 RepID=UPI00047859AB|nr:phytase [Kallotenue papyrolyticum]
MRFVLRGCGSVLLLIGLLTIAEPAAKAYRVVVPAAVALPVSVARPAGESDPLAEEDAGEATTASPTANPASVSAIAARVETEPVHTSGDAADDAAVWIHPTDPSLSLIIGTDKLSGLSLYDLNGRELQYRADGRMNNIDLRYNVPLAGEAATILVTSNRSKGGLSLYRMNEATRQLESIGARTLYPAFSPYGVCMYRSLRSNATYVFATSGMGEIEQWQLFDNGNGKIDGRRVRQWSVGSKSEGCVADDQLGVLYVAEERVGIWKYSAEPDAGNVRTQVDQVGSLGHLTADIEGLTLYYAADGTGYLIASSQGDDSFAVYGREGANVYLGSFVVHAGNGIDGITHTDGIDVNNSALGASFPGGLFVVQDSSNDGQHQNFKLVDWRDIAAVLGLRVDTGWEPRAVGRHTPRPTPTVTPSPGALPTSGPTATPTSSSASRLSIPIEADARVEEGHPTTNFGASTTLRVDGGSDPDVESYLRVTVSGITGEIQSAKLRLYPTSSSAAGLTLSTTHNNWLESAITWSNRPARASTIATINRASSGTWLEFDVSAQVHTDGTYSFVVSTTSPDGFSLGSRESPNRPELVLTLSTPTTATPTATPTSLPAPSPTASPTPTPTSRSSAIPLTWRFEAEDYRGYYDTTAGNSGGAYRNDDVDIQRTQDSGGGYNVGWIARGEWLAYDINLPSDAQYRITLRVATPYTDRRLRVEVDGVNLSGTVTLPATGSYQTWTDVTLAAMHLQAGWHRVRIVAETSSFNINYIVVGSP